MSDEFMRRLAPHVEEMLPVRDGEGLDDYCARVRLEPVVGRRAMIAAAIGCVGDEFKTERQTRKTTWVTAARVAFNAGQRMPCAVCGKYEGLTQAHHTLPLGIQFDAGATVPIQDFDWLCPTHHVAQHVYIDDFIARVTKSIRGMPPEESDALHHLGAKMVELFLTLPHWERVGHR